MLYFDAKLKETELQVFVDTGAQMTIMDEATAEKCNLSSLIDKR